MRYRITRQPDVPAMARIRAADPQTEEAWTARISAYLAGEHHPQHALLPRVSYVALDDDAVVGYIAGHLSRRYGCAGELQWINVVPEQRGTGVTSPPPSQMVCEAEGILHLRQYGPHQHRRTHFL